MSFFHQEKQSASPFSYPVPLSSYLFFSREYGGGSAQIHEHVAAFHPLDDAAYYFSLAFFEFAVDGFFFRLSYSLHDDLFGGLRRYHAEIFFCFQRESYLVTGFGVLFYLFGFFQHYVVLGIEADFFYLSAVRNSFLLWRHFVFVLIILIRVCFQH